MQNAINQDNNAQNGGGIENEGYVKSTNDQTYANYASDKAVNYGGAIDNDGTIVLYGDGIGYNSTQGNGGGVYNRGNASFTMYGGIIQGNGAGGWGGGVYNEGTMDLEDGTLIEDNSAFQGGGLRLTDLSTTTLNMVTITGNTATGENGVVANGIGFMESATMHFTGVTDKDDPGGNPVQC